MRDYDNYTKTMPYVEDGKVLSREGGDKVTVLTPSSTRPSSIAATTSFASSTKSNWQEGKGFMKVTWTVVNDMDDKVPVLKDVVRVGHQRGLLAARAARRGQEDVRDLLRLHEPRRLAAQLHHYKANTIAVPSVFEAIKKTVMKK